MRKLLLSLVLASTFAIGSAATAVASTPPTNHYDTVVGIETGAPTIGGSPFAGYAFGQLPGQWAALVAHGALPTDQNGFGAILGGTFTLRSQPTVTGIFNANLQGIQMLASSSDEDSGFCTQTYLISDGLLLTTPAGTGSFNATLVHYGFLVAGKCQVFFATVSGTVVLTF
jgi:hypothetical protein